MLMQSLVDVVLQLWTKSEKQAFKCHVILRSRQLHLRDRIVQRRMPLRFSQFFNTCLFISQTKPKVFIEYLQNY